MSMQYSDLIDSLFIYQNIHLRYLNPLELSKGTILEQFFIKNLLNQSQYPIEHMSDVLRILLLSEYGGQYLDLDVFSLVPLSVINQANFACPEDKNLLTNAVINLDKNSEIASLYLE